MEEPTTKTTATRTTARAYGGSGPAIVLAVIIAAIVIAGYMYVQSELQTTDSNPVPPTTGQSSTPPAATTPPPATTPPQGNTGPVTTEGQGTGPHSPQGETPPNMQTKPEGSQ